MKAVNMILGSFFAISIAASAAFAQQQFTQTVTMQNKNCNSTCSVIDVPDLNSNPAAVIFITPIGNAQNLNPHNVGAYYMYLNKWSVFNLDGSTIAAGAQYNVEYYVNSDASKFVYVVPQRVHLTDVSYIDHAGLNSNPNAQIRYLPHVSGSIGNIWNKYDVNISYDTSASKWFIANANGNPISPDAAYNIIFAGGGAVISPNGTKTLACNCLVPTSLPPNGSASGDLTGNYPNPTVKGIQGKPVSGALPAVGQILKWNGSAWEPANDNTGTGGGPAYNAGTGLSLNGVTFNASTNSQIWNASQIASHPISNTAPTVGQVLKWNGTAWEPAAAAGAKPSVVYFTESNPIGMLQMLTPNVNTAPIGGLNNQSFNLAQSGRVVYHTVIAAQNGSINAIGSTSVNVWLTVEILNSSGAVVSRATAETVLTGDQVFTINAVGIGELPAGTYHTSVTMNRGANGGPLRVFDAGYAGDHQTQGGQMIVEIFPD